jgi:hypothetical protein
MPALSPQVSFRDAAVSIRCALEVPLTALPSRYERFFITAAQPHGQYRVTKVPRSGSQAL